MKYSSDPNFTPPPAPRWWPLPAIVAIGVLSVVFIRMQETDDQQSQTVACMLAVVVDVALVLLWIVGFSRLPLPKRAFGALIYFASLGVLAALFRIDGFSGDLVPIFVPRWSAAAAPLEVPEAAKEPAAQPVPGAADFTQFFGSNRDGKLAGPKLARDWRVQPPEELWRTAVGQGWSGFVVAGRRAITQEQHGPEETVVCRDLLTGDVLWAHRDQARYASDVAGVGPRATPTIVGDRVFTQGSTGLLNCLELASGEPVWSRNILTDAKADEPAWGVAGSPLALRDLVVVNPGGKGRSIVAYRQKDGSTAWYGGDDRAQWSAPVLATLAGREQILMFGGLGVTGHDAADGKPLWSYPWRGQHPHVAMPVAVGADRVLIASGYGTGSQLIAIAEKGGQFVAKKVWKKLTLKAKFANYLVHGGHAYGFDDGVLTCVDVRDGRRKWKRGRYGHGQLLLVGDVLLATTETGSVVLVEATPAAHRELARLEVFTHKTWNPPALAGRYLLLRNDQEAACLRLPVLE